MFNILEYSERFDKERIEELKLLWSEGTHFLEELYGEYLKTVLQCCALLESALRNQNNHLIRTTAHSLKEASHTVGLKTIEGYALEIITLLGSNKVREVKKMIDKIKHEYLFLEKELNRSPIHN